MGDSQSVVGNHRLLPTSPLSKSDARRRAFNNLHSISGPGVVRPVDAVPC